MDYLKIYDNLINDAKVNPKSDEYKESHHIIPKCLGGNDSPENLVRLTARQHYLAHWLLYKIYGTSSLVHAWYSMSRIGKGQGDRTVNSHLFERCKKQRRKHLSEKYSGDGNNFYGKTHSEKTKQYLSELHSGKVYKSDEQIKDWVESVAKKPKTKNHREKIGRKGLVMLQHTITGEIVRVLQTDSRLNSTDWVNPRKITPEKKYKCLYCEVITTPSNLKRWHNDNCKRK